LDTIDIGPARLGDAERILQLQYAAYRIEAERYNDYDLPPLRQTLDGLLRDFATHTILVARHSSGFLVRPDDQIVGSVRARIIDGTAHIRRLAVDPVLHGRGIGRQLLWGIEQSTAPVDRYQLFTGHRSERNLRLYERAGYRRIRTEQRATSHALVYLEKIAPTW
jgi:ribosomal protein S18 acetylase RimI-like enzyme